MTYSAILTEKDFLVKGVIDLQRGVLSDILWHMQKTGSKDKNEDTLVEKMFRAGAHYGYSKARRHPSVSKHIYATKYKSDIINLEKTSEELAQAIEFVKELGSTGKVLLFVGTKPEARETIKNAAMSLGMPYVNERWIGGTLSNFSEIKKRVTELENYHKDVAEGGLSKYTKKERGVLAKKMEKLERYYSGLVGIKKTPDALFLVDARAEHIARAEAKDKGVPIIALVNSDSNIKGIEYPVVCNDASVPSIKLMTEMIADAYKKESALAPAKAE